jgi:methionyl-tRNA formyltransferase
MGRMSEGEAASGGLRILFLGLPAGASAQVLQALLHDGRRVIAVVVPATAAPHLLARDGPPVAPIAPPASPSIPLIDSAAPVDTLSVAWANGVPVLAVSDLHHPQTATALAGLEADVACAACFPWRIPPDILRLPRFGFLNLHPSLLPAYRGPSPLFWQLRDGAPTGVTIHYMDEDFDTGPIAAQQAVDLPNGSSGPGAERLLTGVGIELLRDILSDLAEGIVRRQPQPTGGSYFGHPEPGDFTLSTDWPVRRAFNFMCGTADYGLPYRVEVEGDAIHLAVAKGFAPDQEMDQPSVRRGRNILIRFNPGVLNARMIR